MAQKRKIILASTSASRKELLEKVGLVFTVEPSNYEEDNSLNLPPRKLVEFLSKGKAEAVARKHADAIIIGADSIGVFKGKIVGKPKNKADAKRTLQELSGKTHLLITGFTIIDTKTGKKITKSVETKVSFRKLTSAEITTYVASGEPLGRAASYAIQGRGMHLIEKIEGDYSSAAGLPVSAVFEVLKKLRVKI